MSDPMDRARALVGGLEGHRGDLRLVGGLAVRAWVGALARTSLDVDLVALSPSAHAAVLAKLEAEGFRLGESGGWWRGVRTTDEGREVVDLAGHPVTNPRTFDAMQLRAPHMTDVQGLHVVGVDDLVYLKLCAGRDQDLVDICLLAAHCSPDGQAIASAARSDDVERTVARSALEGRLAVSRGWLDATFEELLGRSVAPAELEAFDGLLRRLLEEERL